MSPAERTALADSLRQVAARMFELARARDVNGTIALYGRPHEFVHFDNGATVNWPTLETGIRTTFARLTENDISWVAPPTIVVIDRDAAIIAGEHHFSGGGGLDAHNGLWTGVMQRIGGEWKIIHSHSSDQATTN